MRLIDFYCCGGGASMGFHRAGFTVYGVDIDPQPHYPFAFHLGDALDVAARLARGEYVPFVWPGGWVEYLTGSDFAAAAGSPPCQLYTLAQRIQGNEHPDLVAPTREAFNALGVPWIIENVEGAPLRDPITLCGTMFAGLRVYRHRIFESNVVLAARPHGEHAAPLRKMGRPPQVGDFMHVVGNFSGVAYAREAMGIDWMVRDELREAIPPAYTEYLGLQLMNAVRSWPAREVDPVTHVSEGDR